jgi:hypothetical protein
MKKLYRLFLVVITISALSACNLPEAGTPENPLSAIVATELSSTLAAFTEIARTLQVATPTVERPSATPIGVLSPTVPPTPTPTPTTTLTLTMTISVAPTNTPIPKPGTIEGSISGYPYGSMGSLAIVAYGQEPPYNYSYFITNPGDSFYSMTSKYLLPGIYQVVAYDSSDHTGGCPGNITVISEQTVNCDITHWGGGYPARPSGVPRP